MTTLKNNVFNHSVLYHTLFFAKVAYQLTAEHVPEFYYEHVAGTILLATHLSDKHYLSEKRLRGRISFVNNGWRELKETPSSNWKIPCLAIMFGVSEKRPSSN
ncbi:hypothetical protein T08_4190 [Trichinella sp. T8]|nr:hypothetical protein T08_4190 [Trichinella sp. T8]